MGFFLGVSENGFVISDHSDLAAPKEPTNPLDKDSSVSLLRHDPNDPRPQIRFQILPNRRTLTEVIRYVCITFLYVKVQSAIQHVLNICVRDYAPTMTGLIPTAREIFMTRVFSFAILIIYTIHSVSP